MRPARSAPARTLGSTASVTFTVPVANAVLILLPSASVIRTEGMVIVGSAPPSPAGGPPATLSATSTAIAPAFWAFFTLVTKVHVPRSTSAMRPISAAPLVIAEHASVIEGTASTAMSTSPVTP